MPSKAFTTNLTSYDLLKSLALVLMVIDHIGYYFYPDQELFRAVGRASLPIWMFLIGFARSRDLPPLLWAGAGALIVSSFIFGSGIFPLNILVTIIATRLVLDRIASISFRNWEMMTYSAFVLSVMNIFMLFLFEYGTSAILIALAGYVARHGAELNLSRRAQTGFMAYTVFFYALCQMVVFNHMDKIEVQVMAVCIGLVAILLYFFKPQEVEENMPRPAVWALQFMGRWTLEIYIVHLILFKLAACYYGLNGHGWFGWDWIR